jgi:hypothetical protein
VKSIITRKALATAGAVSALITSLAFGFAGTAQAATAPPSSYTVDTGWVSDFNGGCQAKAHVVYYPGSDQAHIETTVTSPYLFAACRVNTQVFVGTKTATYPGAVHYAMACAVLDPSCASTQLQSGDYYGQTPQLTSFVDSLNDALEAAGLPRTYTRALATTGITVVFSKA